MPPVPIDKTYSGLAALPFVVVRISTVDLNGVARSGTGFFYRYDFEGGVVLFVVSNKHVLVGQKSITLALPRLNAEGRRSLEPAVEVEIEGAWVVEHPSALVDLAMTPLGPFTDVALRNGIRTAAVSFGDELIIAEADEDQLHAATSVLMVGFPNGLMDEHNSLPLVRRGSLATPYAADYKGQPNFVVDIAAFGGSSGSPVFAYFDGVRQQRDNLVFSAPSVQLLGILHSGPQLTLEGAIVDQPTPTAYVSITRQMINLGYCAKAKLLRDFRPLIEARLPKPGSAPSAEGMKA